MLVLVIVYLAVLTWQTMGAFRCARRIGGFWPIVAIVVFGVAWLGKIVENFDVSPPLGVVLIIWFSAIAMVSLPMRSLGKPKGGRPGIAAASLCLSRRRC
jgi:hypothetical protein